MLIYLPSYLLNTEYRVAYNCQLFDTFTYGECFDFENMYDGCAFE